jgi:hypothetical protein
MDSVDTGQPPVKNPKILSLPPRHYVRKDCSKNLTVLICLVGETCGYRCCDSSEEFFPHVPVHICQSEMAALVFVG